MPSHPYGHPQASLSPFCASSGGFGCPAHCCIPLCSSLSLPEDTCAGARLCVLLPLGGLNFDSGGRGQPSCSCYHPPAPKCHRWHQVQPQHQGLGQKQKGKSPFLGSCAVPGCCSSTVLLQEPAGCAAGAGRGRAERRLRAAARLSCALVLIRSRKTLIKALQECEGNLA